jgi:outer membrane protein OmpA-like peptidoglycan-associated protein
MLSPAVHAQFLKEIKQRAEEKLKQKAQQKVDQQIDKTVDDATTGKKKNDNSSSQGNNSNANSAGNKTNSSTTDGTDADAPEKPAFKTYSRYDFVPGEKVIVYEDFSQDAIGDFPAKWNTNSSGEVVKAEGQEGHWLMISKKGRFIPEYITSLPDNFTLQFDVICNEKFSFYSNTLELFMLTGPNSKSAFEYSFIAMEKRSGVKIGVHPASAGSKGGIAYAQNFENGEPVINNEVNTTQFNSNAGKTKIKVSVWRQKQRIRVYLNEEKVFDLPRAFTADKTYSTLLFQLWSDMHNDNDRYLINNIKLAVGAPDTRSKLLTEGKFVTRGILFDVNSDVIKPESYGVLKDIANVLTENPQVKIKIIGHTDTDGDDNNNLELSKRRAEAVKRSLSAEFTIDAGRIQTDGKGEKEPVDSNSTAQGKANNRRVEFIKL